MTPPQSHQPPEPEPGETPLELQELAADYEIEGELGRGGTAVVYRARERTIDRVVAIKVIRAPYVGDDELVARLEREARLVARLDHPNVVSAFDGFPTGSGAFLALQYCPGGTLDQLLLEKGRLPKERASALVLDVAEGLAYTHDRSVLHRDVKPANVFLTVEGRAKLGDFGTGIFLAEDTTDRVGTAFYMAPEIFEGGRATKRSDIYSLAVLAYEVLSGERPFVGDSYDSLMLGHLTGIPRDLMVVRPDLSRNVVRVVAQAMSRNPERRFGTVGEFLHALRAAVGRPMASQDLAPETRTTAVTGRSGRAPTRPETPAPAEPAAKTGLFGWLKRRKD